MFYDKKEAESEEKALLLQGQTASEPKVVSKESNRGHREFSSIILEQSDDNDPLNEKFTKLWVLKKLCEMDFNPKQAEGVVENLGSTKFKNGKKEELLLSSVEALLNTRNAQNSFWRTPSQSFQGKRRKTDSTRRKRPNFLSTHFASFGRKQNNHTTRSLLAFQDCQEKAQEEDEMSIKKTAERKPRTAHSKEHKEQIMEKEKSSRDIETHDSGQEAKRDAWLDLSKSDPKQKLLENLEQEALTDEDSDLGSQSGEITDSVQTTIIVCSICLSAKRVERFVQLSVCNHYFCKRCLQQYLNELINSSRLRHIACPKEGCQIQISEEELELILKEAVYSKYKKFKSIMQLNANPDLRWCVRAGCDKYLLLQDKGARNNFYLVCECGQEMCSNCLSEWHEGLTCDQAVDKGYKQYTESVTVRNCPSCKRRIEKSGGCNQMRCAICELEFCWLCGKTINENHYKWWNVAGCPGMQQSLIEPSSVRGRARRCVNNTARFIILLLLLTILSPLLLLICLVLLVFAPILLYSSQNEEEGCSFCRFLCYIVLLATGFVLLPCNILLSPLILRRLWMDFMDAE